MELRPDIIGFQEIDLRIDQGNWLCQRSTIYPAEAWPADWLRFVTVDYVFVSPSVQVTGAQVTFDRPDADDPTLYPSDHFGLAAAVECP